jgi:hypothetical protein
MSLKRVSYFEFRYIPWDTKFPVKFWTLGIVASSRKEAELIAMNNGYKVFDQDATVEVSEKMEGYVQVPDEDKNE